MRVGCTGCWDATLLLSSCCCNVCAVSYFKWCIIEERAGVTSPVSHWGWKCALVVRWSVWNCGEDPFLERGGSNVHCCALLTEGEWMQWSRVCTDSRCSRLPDNCSFRKWRWCCGCHSVTILNWQDSLSTTCRSARGGFWPVGAAKAGTVFMSPRLWCFEVYFEARGGHTSVWCL